MSGLSIAAYFPFRRIIIVAQQVSAEATEAHIQAEPDKRFHPVCHGCGKRAAGVHSWTQRKVLDLSVGPAKKVWITCRYRKILCSRCQAVRVEDLGFFHPYLRVTARLARFVYELCQVMTVTDVAKNLGLNWKTVKEIDKYYLERDFGQPDYTGLRILAVDEISIRKGQRYLTVVLDYLTGRIVYVGKDRKAKTLKRFFNMLSVGQRKRIEAVAMDMWDPFINAVKKNCPMPRSSLICSTLSPASAG